MNWSGFWLKCGLASSKVSLIRRLTNDEFALIHVSKPDESIFKPQQFRGILLTLFLWPVSRAVSSTVPSSTSTSTSTEHYISACAYHKLETSFIFIFLIAWIKNLAVQDLSLLLLYTDDGFVASPFTVFYNLAVIRDTAVPKITCSFYVVQCYNTSNHIILTIFHIFVPSDIWPKFAPVVTLVQGHVCTKLEVSVASLFQENQRHVTGRETDGVQLLMLPLGGLDILSHSNITQ